MSSNITRENNSLKMNAVDEFLAEKFNDGNYVKKLISFLNVLETNIKKFFGNENSISIIGNIQKYIENKNSLKVIEEFQFLMYALNLIQDFENEKQKDFKIWPYIKSNNYLADILLNLIGINKQNINFCEIGSGKGLSSLKFIAAFHLLDIEYTADFFEINDDYIEIFNKLFSGIQNIKVLKDDILLVDYAIYNYIYSYCPFNNPILEFLLERRVFMSSSIYSIIYFYGYPHYVTKTDTYYAKYYNIDIRYIKLLLTEKYLHDEVCFIYLNEVSNKILININEFFDVSHNIDKIKIKFIKKYLEDFKYNNRLKEIFVQNKNVDVKKFSLDSFEKKLNNKFKNPELVTKEKFQDFIIRTKTLNWFQKMFLLELDKYSVEMMKHKYGFQKI